MELFVLAGEVLLGVFAGQHGEQAEELLLVLDHHSEQLCQLVYVLEVVGGLLPDERTILMVEYIDHNGGVLINFLPNMLVMLKNHNQRILLKSLSIKPKCFPPLLKALNHLFDLELFPAFKCYLLQDVFVGV